MSAVEKIIASFWKFTEANDQKRLSGQTFPTDLVEVNNLQYIEDGHEHHRLDLYYPKSALEKPKRKLPVIIDIHGGGWFYGDKELNKNYCLHLAQRGFAVFNISYRLVPEVCMKEQLQDCMEALKFISEIMNDYPCNKKRVYITGDSAGGQLAAFAVAANCSKKIRKVYETVSPELKIRAAALVSPVPYLKPSGFMRAYLPHIMGKQYKSEGYAKYIDFDKVVDECRKYPPTIFFTSAMDVIAKGQTVKAYKCLKKNGMKAKLHMKYNPSLMHVYQVLDPEAEASVKAINSMIRFFKKY